MGGAHEAHVCFARCGSTHALEGSFLNDAQERHLCAHRYVADFIEKERAAFCELESAASLRDRLDAPVAVIDVDAHHGNGTQAIFYEDPTVLVGSVHVDPGAGWFPHFLGFAAETGRGSADGANRNLPIEPGSGDESWVEAGGLPLTGLTALQALTAGRVGSGDTVLIHAAAGGVGHLAVQIARILGAVRVLGTASPGGFEFVEALGAEPVGYGDDLATELKRLVPDGVDAALDFVGGDTVDWSWPLVRDPSPPPAPEDASSSPQPANSSAATARHTMMGLMGPPLGCCPEECLRRRPGCPRRHVRRRTNGRSPRSAAPIASDLRSGRRGRAACPARARRRRRRTRAPSR